MKVDLSEEEVEALLSYMDAYYSEATPFDYGYMYYLLRDKLEGFIDEKMV